MKQLLTAFLFLCGASCSLATAYTSTQSGLFTAGSTWVGGTAPAVDGDTWTIASTHVVAYDKDASALANGWGACVITGTLLYTNGLPHAELKMNGNLSGAGSFNIGTSSDPVTNQTGAWPALVMNWKAGQITMTNNAALNWYAATNAFLDYITNTVVVAADNTNLFFTSTVANVASNDVVYIDNHNVRGQGGQVSVVYSVETNRITLCRTIETTGAGLVTNTWWGVVMGTTVATNDRTNGTQVVKLSRPVVYQQPTLISSTGAFNASNTNTIYGVRFCHLGRGPADSRNGCTFVSCVGNNNSGGGIVNGGTGNTITSCVGNNISTGGIASGGTGHTITFCVGNNNSSGGIASGGIGFTITSCVGNNISSGGISSGGTGFTITSCVGNNNTSGGIVNGGIGYTITSCVGNNNSSGGISSAGVGHTITSCVGNNNSSGGISYLGSQYVAGCYSTNQAAPGIAYLPTESVFLCDSNTTAYTLTTGNRAPYDMAVINETNWSTDAGLVYFTNTATTFSSGGTYYHLPGSASLTNKPVSLYETLTLKPGLTQTVNLWLFLTNTMGWSYQVTRGYRKPLSATNVFGTTGWTNIPVVLKNTGAANASFTLWITAYATNGLYPGWSWVTWNTERVSVSVQ